MYSAAMQALDVLQRLVNVHRAAGAGCRPGPSMRSTSASEAIRLAQDHVHVFVQLRSVEMAREELRRAAQAAERILDLVRRAGARGCGSRRAAHSARARGRGAAPARRRAARRAPSARHRLATGVTSLSQSRGRVTRPVAAARARDRRSRRRSRGHGARGRAAKARSAAAPAARGRAPGACPRRGAARRRH